jgi:dephospho-CoA kinase
MPGVLKVGLTGGIACGRTTLAAWLKDRGMLVLDADSVAHELVSGRGGAVGEIESVFGPGVLAGEGGVDRAALARIVFADAGKRAKLEAILHPRILEIIDGDIASFEARRGEGCVIVDAALMIETRTAGRYHRLVVAHCPPAVQLQRLMRRGALSEGEAKARIAAQAPLSTKMRAADYLIDTGGTLEETRARTLEVAELLEEDARLLPALPERRKGLAP